MSARGVERALQRLAGGGCTLAPLRDGDGFGVQPKGDRRRRPMVRLSATEVGALEASGAIVRDGDGYVLSDAGAARARRENAEPNEAYAAQHRPIVDRYVITDAGPTRVRGHDVDAALRRLAAMRDANGAAWLSGAELAATAQLRSDWAASERGLVRGSDWSAPPRSGSGRGPGSALEQAMASHCDARRRLSDALDALAPPLRRVVERVCLQEQGLEALERGEGWPARSGKIALKLALSQLAAQRVSAG